MKNSAKLKTLVQYAEKFWDFPQSSPENYPTSIVDLVIFHKLHFYLPPTKAWTAYGLLKSEFVDWNEVRVSVVREIQEHLSTARNSLELTVFVKDFLESIHKECRKLDLEHLVEENLTDIRKFFKKIRGIDPATIDLILRCRKGHPVIPLTPEMETALAELGVVSGDDSRDRKAKSVFEAVGEPAWVAVHHCLLHLCHAEPNDLGDAYTGLPTELTGSKPQRRKGSATQSSKSVKKPVTSKRVRHTTKSSTRGKTTAKKTSKKTPKKK